MMMIRKMFKGVLQTQSYVFSRRSTSGDSQLLAMDGRLARAQEFRKVDLDKLQESRKVDLAKAEESRKVYLAKAEENSKLRQEKLEESRKVDLDKLQESRWIWPSRRSR